MYVLGTRSLSASLSRLLPSPKAPGISSGRIRHTCRMSLYILSRLYLRCYADIKELSEVCLRRVQMAETRFQPPRHSSFPP